MNIYEKQYEEMTSIPTYWHNKSGDLFLSAHILWKAMRDDSDLQIPCYSTYIMLMGMSFEALIKAYCVAKKVEDKKIFESHALTQLASEAGIKSTKKQNKILDILTEYVVWDGKYPAPKRPTQLKHHLVNVRTTAYDKERIGNLDLYKQNDTFDFENLKVFWRKLSDEYMDKYCQT